jgi:hypothetical protein
MHTYYIKKNNNAYILKINRIITISAFKVLVNEIKKIILKNNIFNFFKILITQVLK